ncbi:MAG TPA: nucleoside hydrolase [Bacteroidales bacterium]|nr:nucleoside hydrolase [Bacteroidales bacterium]HPT22368.1 nucleoside hydrolase [Bacteroidales bacterium]
MKQLVSATLLILLVIYGCTSQHAKKVATPVKIIFDSDFGPDYDDVGALAFLHAVSDSGRAEILATVSSNRYELSAPSMDVINTYFGRPGLQTGAPKNHGVNMAPPQHWTDSITANYPHSIKSTDEVPDAVTTYRKILSSQPDSSVTIVTVGFLTNISDLLKSQPDDISSLSGHELVSRKVKRLVSMAGKFQEGKEFNVYMDSVSSEYAFNNWPGEIIFSGFEIGNDILTGLRLTKSEIKNNPVKDVFRISMTFSENDRNGRMSWDETAVLIGVYGTNGFFDTVSGKIIVNKDGSNSWEYDSQSKQKYVVRRVPASLISNFIEDRMMHIPFRKVK